MNASVHADPHPVGHYIKIWATVLVLFIISVSIALTVDNRPLVLVTAFSIATIQAYLVGAYFMHLKYEKMYITFLLVSMLLALALLYFGSMADENHPAGTYWQATDTLQIMQDHKGSVVE